MIDSSIVTIACKTPLNVFGVLNFAAIDCKIVYVAHKCVHIPHKIHIDLCMFGFQYSIKLVDRALD